MRGNDLTPFAIPKEDDDLGDFKPKSKSQSTTINRPSNDDKGAFPSRESAPSPVDDCDHWGNFVQLNLKVAEALKVRFKNKAKSRGANFNAMLSLTLDSFDILEPSEHRLKRMAEARGLQPEDLIKKALDAFEEKE